MGVSLAQSGCVIFYLTIPEVEISTVFLHSFKHCAALKKHPKNVEKLLQKSVQLEISAY